MRSPSLPRVREPNNFCPSPSRVSVNRSCCGRARLEVLAMDFQRAVHCIDGELAKPVCNGFNLLNSGLDILIFIAGYLENPAHLDILTAVSSSPCLHNETAQRLTGTSAHMCLMAFMGEPPLQQDICLGLKTLERCSVHAVASGCNLASASFLQSIWDYAAEPAVQLHLLGLSDLSPIAGDCNQHDYFIKRFVKRALETMK